MIGTRESQTQSPRWEFLLSHHLPGRFGRTLRVTVGARTLHVCARCTGQVAGALSFVLLFLAGASRGPGLFLPMVQIIIALAPIPSAVDWLTQSLGRRESTNRLRVVSGFLLGMAFTDALILLVSGEWTFFLVALAVVGLYVVTLGVALKLTGGWRRVLEEHFPGIEVGAGR